MVIQNILKVVRRRGGKQLTGFLIFLVGLLFSSDIAIAQEVSVPESVKTFPNAKCFWSYGVERVSTRHDSVHKYIIRVALQQYDSSGNNKGRLHVKHALIFCNFLDKGIFKKIYCKQNGLLWIAKFKISTNQPLPLEIIANYNNHQMTMPVTLNRGTYLGERDN